jgi:hypothetical protein
MMQLSYPESLLSTLRQATILPMEKSNDTEKMRQAMSKVKRMLIIFFDIKGAAHKEFVLTDKLFKTVNCTMIRSKIMFGELEQSKKIFMQNLQTCIHQV